jgi:hypothetical protein
VAATGKAQLGGNIVGNKAKITRSTVNDNQGNWGGP